MTTRRDMEPKKYTIDAPKLTADDRGIITCWSGQEIDRHGIFEIMLTPEQWDGLVVLLEMLGFKLTKNK